MTDKILLQCEHTENVYQGEADCPVFCYFNFLCKRHERHGLLHGSGGVYILTSITF